jgi:hypothetical protein
MFQKTHFQPSFTLKIPKKHHKDLNKPILGHKSTFNLLKNNSNPKKVFKPHSSCFFFFGKIKSKQNFN